MKLEELTQIKQTHDTEAVNQLLSQGFRVIKVLSSRTQVGEREEIKPIYILGR